MDDTSVKKIAEKSRRARGAMSNDTGRFEKFTKTAIDDGWVQDEPKPFRTQVSIERPRSIIVRNSSPDVPFDRSLNPYRGCEHGCIYCFARPTHAYLGYSPGLDFETRLIARPDAAKVLDRTLRHTKYQVAPLAIGTNTDPYQPIEGRYRVMRQVLQVLERFHHPVTIVTKGTLIERDIDILSRLALRGLVHVGISITTLDATLSRKMEPRVPAPTRRLEIIRKLVAKHIPVRVMVAPVVPALTDHELEPILEASAQAGAKAASYILLRLPGEVADLFQEWLESQYPDRSARVMNRMREMRRGEDYRAEFGTRMTGQGVQAKLLRHRFKLACKTHGLASELPELRRDLFEPPLAQGNQLSLF